LYEPDFDSLPYDVQKELKDLQQQVEDGKHLYRWFIHW